MPIIIKNGKVYGDRSVTLSQAEYNALSEVEKNNGTTYYIYDVNGVVTADDVALDGGTVETLAGSVATFESSPATATHEVGDHILWNGQLYTVTAAIAVGETLTVGTNITSTNVGSELTALNAGLIVQFLSTGWTGAATVDGVTYVTQTISVSSVSGHPVVGIVPISGTLPTSAEQGAFNSVSYFTADSTAHTVKGYAKTAPSATFAVVVKGAS